MSDTTDPKSPSARGEQLPIFVHSTIDDLGLTLGAFRVYGHLARRAGKSNEAWPSYSTIGEQCFRSSYPKAKDATLRRKAIAAVDELETRGLVEVERRKLEDSEGHRSNVYRLVPLTTWQKRVIDKAKHGDQEALDEQFETDVPF